MRHTLGRFVAVLAGLALLAGAPAAAGAARASALAGAGVSAAAAAAPNATWWRPRLGYKFQYTLKFPFDMAKHVKPGVQVYLIDGFDNTAETVAAMHGAGLLPVCYFSAGSYEDWRTDKGEFNASDYMNALSGWDGEYWIDVRSANVKRIMRARMEMCKAKGFVAVDPDNVDGYSNKNGIGFGAADQLAYNKWLAATAHELGLGAGLKNDLGQIDDLVADFDFFVNEQCQDYDECQLYLPAKTGAARGPPFPGSRGIN
ncbi:MAG: endo alpha-1,4 polygalactosaminidase precursor [Monoraphidium minutum]|nr:MAG: endo alpha-1,4 polygalactosaminidase precursor [Monoraphidium minutum]